MATKVNIDIRGLALCYRVGNAWKVDFLCDSNHRLFFTNDADPKPERPLGDNDTLLIENDPDTSGAHSGNNFLKIFNIVADAHTGGVELVNPTLPGKRRVSLTINHAKLHFKKPTNKKYGIKKKGSTDPFKELRHVAEIVSAEIKIKAGGSFVFKIDGAVQTTPITNNCTLTFDNDCRNLAHPECQPGNDSQLFYELIKGKEVPPVRYEFTRIDTIRGKRRSHPDGNCDPAVSDPPPGP